jgi:hypothetical protein
MSRLLAGLVFAAGAASGAAALDAPEAIAELTVRGPAAGMASTITAGRLIFRGEGIPLSVAGLVVVRGGGGGGPYLAAAVLAHLARPEDAEGRYTGDLEGELVNENGAVLRLAASRPGVALGLAPEGLLIRLDR